MRTKTEKTHPRPRAARLQDRLQEQLRFERLISELSARFVSLPHDRLDREIVEALHEIRTFFACDRCGLLGVFHGGTSVHLTHGSYGKGIVEVPPSVELAGPFPWCYRRLILEGETVHFKSVMETPPEAVQDRRSWAEMGVRSQIAVPLRTEMQVTHLIVIQSMGEERDWPSEYIPRLRLLGEIFMNALEQRRAAEALLESEERLSLAAAAAGMGFWVLDPQAEVFWVTPKGRELFGIPFWETASVGRIFQAIHPDDRGRARAAMEAAPSRADDMSGVEYRVVLPDGEVRWLASRGRVLSGPSSSGPRLMGVTFDITERKRMEEAARLAEQEFRTMFDLSAVGMAQVDPPTGRFLQANAKYCEITGYPLEELRNLTYRDITHPEDEPHDAVQYARVLAGEAPYWTSEKRYVRKDGTIRWVSVSGTMVRDDVGRPLRSMAAIVDITDRHLAEDALRESEAKYRGLYESLRDAYVRVDMEGGLLEWNGAYSEMLGYSDGELAGLTYQQITPEKWHEAEAAIIRDHVLGRGYSDVYEKEYRRKDGTVFPVELRTFLLRSREGEASGLWAIVRDISERRRGEEEAQTLRDELAHVTRVATLGELTASLAHELNQPLTAIQSNAQTAQLLLERGGVAAGELTDILHDIVADNRRASEMIRHLRAALKKQGADLQFLDIHEVVQEVMAIVMPDILRRDAMLTLDLEEALPMVRGDKIQLQQVLVNLMVNALEAMAGSRGGRLAVRCSRHGTHEVRLTVEDTGPGIPEGKLEGVFEPFYTSKPQGLGMGLAICRSITQAHGGRLWAENRPVGGAAFHLALPVAPSEG